MKHINLIIFLTILCISLIVETTNAQQLRVQGTNIVNDRGENILLRGIGPGGWMLQEPYMLQMSDIAVGQHQIRAKIEETIGKQNTEKFYELWWANHFTKKDVDALAKWGFNSIRVPMHYNLFTLPIEKEPVKGKNTWLDKGFVMIDSLLEWCKTNNMYLILDLHAAPGGQGRDANISDYNPKKPSLWESKENKQKTIALWRKLAERYADEPWIGGYDLINEPNWAFTEGANKNGLDEKNNDAIWQLYIDITKAIREVDKDHIIYIEGNGWATNFTGMPEAWDKNLVINFHGYWCPTNEQNIQKYIDLREEYNLPLWMSESGENSNQWFYERIRIMERNNIGWAWWPVKKIGSVVGPLTIVRTKGYENLIDMWKNNDKSIGKDEATKILMEMTENLKFENCVFHPDVIDALFRQQNQNTAIPFDNNKIPGVWNSTGYDLGRHNLAYRDMNYKNSGEGRQKKWNTGWSYRNDGVDIIKSNDNHKNSNAYCVTDIESGEWLQFTAHIEQTASYNLIIRIKNETESTKITITENNNVVAVVENIDVPDDSNEWHTIIMKDIALNKGKQQIKIYFDTGNFQIGYLQWVKQ